MATNDALVSCSRKGGPGTSISSSTEGAHWKCRVWAPPQICCLGTCIFTRCPGDSLKLEQPCRNSMKAFSAEGSNGLHCFHRSDRVVSVTEQEEDSRKSSSWFYEGVWLLLSPRVPWNWLSVMRSGQRKSERTDGKSISEFLLTSLLPQSILRALPFAECPFPTSCGSQGTVSLPSPTFIMFTR